MKQRTDTRPKGSAQVRGRDANALRRAALTGGQAMVEFALIAGVLILILLMGIQLAIIGDSALAVNQFAYSVARYASVKYSDTNLSSLNGSNSGSDASITALIPPTLVAGSLVISLSPCTPGAGTTNVFGSVATVQVDYDLTASGRIFLPNPFLGITIPTSVSATQRAFCE